VEPISSWKEGWRCTLAIRHAVGEVVGDTVGVGCRGFLDTALTRLGTKRLPTSILSFLTAGAAAWLNILQRRCGTPLPDVSLK
jgi:hypothetical protein